jgi:hypothetical protein
VSKKKFKLSAKQGFFGTLGLIIFVAICFDVYRRANFVPKTPAELETRTLDMMDLEELRLRFDATRVEVADKRPSTIRALRDRLDIVRMMVRKSKSPVELLRSQKLLMHALQNCYAIYRLNELNYDAIQKEFVEIIDLLIQEGNTDSRRTALIFGFDLHANRILDGETVPEIVPKMKAYAAGIRKEFPDEETAAQIERSIFELLFKGKKDDQRIDEIVMAVGDLFSDHPDNRLKTWSQKIKDDLLFREFGMFEIYKEITLSVPGSGARFLQKLPEVLERNPSAHSFGRIIGVCTDLEKTDFYEDAGNGYRMLLDQLKLTDPTDTTNGRLDCENGLRRLANLGKKVTAKFTDATGTVYSIDDPAFENHAFLVCSINSPEDFKANYEQYLSVEALVSRKVELVVICCGLNAQQVNQAFKSFAEPRILLIPDPELNSELYQACPSRISPFLWIISRQHTLQDIDVTVEQIASEMEALRYTQ